MSFKSVRHGLKVLPSPAGLTASADDRFRPNCNARRRRLYGTKFHFPVGEKHICIVPSGATSPAAVVE